MPGVGLLALCGCKGKVDRDDKAMIKTYNLTLLPCELVHLEAILRDKKELAEILQVTVPGGWPHFPEAFPFLYELYKSDQSPTDWPLYFFIHSKDGVLIGSGGFKNAPDDSGVAEIGYEIATEYMNRGYATEAVRGMLARAFSDERVKAVVAHTLPETNASNRVLQKVGMRFVGEFEDPQDGRVWRWQVGKDEYRPA